MVRALSFRISSAIRLDCDCLDGEIRDDRLRVDIANLTILFSTGYSQTREQILLRSDHVHHLSFVQKTTLCAFQYNSTEDERLNDYPSPNNGSFSGENACGDKGIVEARSHS